MSRPLLVDGVPLEDLCITFELPGEYAAGVERVCVSVCAGAGPSGWWGGGIAPTRSWECSRHPATGARALQRGTGTAHCQQRSAQSCTSRNRYPAYTSTLHASTSVSRLCSNRLTRISLPAPCRLPRLPSAARRRGRRGVHPPGAGRVHCGGGGRHAGVGHRGADGRLQGGLQRGVQPQVRARASCRFQPDKYRYTSHSVRSRCSCSEVLLLVEYERQ